MLLDDQQLGRDPPSLGGGATGFGSLRRCSGDGSSSLVGTLTHVLVADDIRAGMEVMPRRGSIFSSWRPARPPALDLGRSSQPRWTGLILVDRIECSVPRLRSSAPVPFSCGVRSTWRFLMQTMQTPETTKVIYGVNELDLDLAGRSVRGIWKTLEQVFNIPRDAVVTVNGTRADDEYVVRPGDEIEFQKAAGVKGMPV